MYASLRTRRLPVIVGRLVAGLLIADEAMGSMIQDVEEMSLEVLANHPLATGLELHTTILILFAGGLGTMLVGYVADSTRISNHR